MSEVSELYISPHAVEQFQLRIAPMSEARARFFIGAGIRQAVNIKLLPDGNTLRIRTRRPFPFEFRAFCVFDEARQAWAVATIVRGDSKVTRTHKHCRAATPNVGEQMRMPEEEACKTMVEMRSRC
ncbi:MAG: hypothetical protein ABIP14_16015 [Blastocatellia bacterium]